MRVSYVEIICRSCGKNIGNCECDDCPECEGKGEVESFEDRWNHATESHYTVDMVEDCLECKGSGKKPGVEQ